MSDPRYQPGIIQGHVLSRTVGLAGWPEIPSLGPRAGGQPFSRCVLCPAPRPDRDPQAPQIPRSSFVTYGGKPVCAECARRVAAEQEARP